MKSQQNEGICDNTERSEVLLDVLSVMLTLRLAPEAVNKSGCKAGFEVGIGLCSPIPTVTKTLRYFFDLYFRSFKLCYSDLMQFKRDKR